ncbi:MAG: hypothetical protein A2919_02140 [Candidatus Spechtbacteria bacterium RIFCSPLOWO2_01_FULL_43_12]|uniref:Vitamin K epoxide reductase domain-containing protein n=1 Tax=Candidatus Spechtbacteria bacterium RIFCSPLOWO2_01_FULL_43_12 TaxID=1802162 RepID=A0A1G2HDX2_9BACT|nr:MAG: hypothetical protein A2919_02140 [Candidatus Spechtbacteria bacterium RIFCSPLOWO2_01_FULL_43_12]
MNVKLYIQKNIFFYFLLLFIGFGGFIFPLIWPQVQGFYALVAFAALAGFCVAAYIFYIKTTNRQLVCPVGSDCNAVVNSKYGKFLGIPLEYLGMLYYSFIVVSYVGLIFYSYMVPIWALALLVLASFGGFLFSLYLLVAQAFLLRKWCIWCLLSAMLSTLIFVASIVSLPALVSALGAVSPVLLAMQFIGYAIGLGSATSATFLFVRFLRDFKLSETELNIVRGISELSWLGLALVFMNKLALYVTDLAYHPAGIEVLFAKMASLFVVAISAAVLLIILAPYLSMVPFTESAKPSLFTQVRRYSFVAGSIALSSWYFSFAMEFVEEISFVAVIIIYAWYTIAAIGIGLLAEKALIKKA